MSLNGNYGNMKKMEISPETAKQMRDLIIELMDRNAANDLPVHLYNYDKKILCIITDGMENSSKEYTSIMIKDLITTWSLSQPDYSPSWGAVDDNGKIYVLFKGKNRYGVESYIEEFDEVINNSFL